MGRINMPMDTVISVPITPVPMRPISITVAGAVAVCVGGVSVATLRSSAGRSILRLRIRISVHFVPRPELAGAGVQIRNPKRGNPTGLIPP